MKILPALSIAVALALAFPASAIAHEPDGAVADPARDRAAILAMQGEYAVDFAFDETVPLQPAYQRQPPLRSGGHEAVIVVEDAARDGRPDRIVLQHILVDPKSGHVTKHWRQDWHWQAAQRFEFSDEQTWRVRDMPAASAAGTWTQCVYEVSDAPRYCGTGRWHHDDGVSTWTSDLSWRPLPRREYTRRSDYNALSVVNRHTVTPSGWSHEQFNTKVQRGPNGRQRALTREFGFNDYRKSEGVDFRPARDYWAATQAYWARVRERWEPLLTSPSGVHLKTRVDGMAMIVPLFEQAQDVEQGGQVSDTAIDAVFSAWVEPATSPTAALQADR
ncbi:DUF6607 family protein [Montanilutibacter psychrotolerans]|uniref:DUF6607 family protein n=1 Tax=Montanilutibacter psychrotolerans TaxID=1327343 RepID=UPI001CC1E747|nr:DUF6607 family protein [Lysobacter psychrotolerans]